MGTATSCSIAITPLFLFFALEAVLVHKFSLMPPMQVYVFSDMTGRVHNITAGGIITYVCGYSTYIAHALHVNS